VNVGLVSGGQTVNTVAPHASGEIDLRYVKLADRQVMLDAIAAVVERCTVPDTSASWEIKGEFLAMECPSSRRRCSTSISAARPSSA